jgi:hypothetical protein
LMAVVLAHVAEAFCLFPEMGWGQPDSARYYLDLFGAALGLILFPLEYIFDALGAYRNSN